MNKPLMRAFGQVLRKSREARELSQEKLALESELDRTYVSMLERGVRQPTISTLHSLGRALGTSGSRLLGAAESGMGEGRANLKAADSTTAGDGKRAGRSVRRKL